MHMLICICLYAYTYAYAYTYTYYTLYCKWCNWKFIQHHCWFDSFLHPIWRFTWVEDWARQKWEKFKWMGEKAWGMPMGKAMGNTPSMGEKSIVGSHKGVTGRKSRNQNFNHWKRWDVLKHELLGVHAVWSPIFPAHIYCVYHIDIICKKHVRTEMNRKLKFSSIKMKLILMELRTISCASE